MSTSSWSKAALSAFDWPTAAPRRTESAGARAAPVPYLERMTDQSDGLLVGRVLGGDREAFGSLVERHQDRMVSYVRHMGFDTAEAHDIVQDGFVRAFKHLRRCGDPDRFAGWLFRIVSNLCRTASGRVSRRRTDRLDQHAGTLTSELPSPDDALERSWARTQVREALDTLPADQKEALVLMYLEGYAVAEIQEMTGASASAVKMRLKRGRDALHTALAPVFEEVDTT